MSRRRVIARSLRSLAVLIAVLGVIDPSFQRSQKVRPEIAVITAGGSASVALVEEVRRVLGESFSVVQAPFSAAVATVVVGDTPPNGAALLPTPTFVVLPAPPSTGARIVGVRHAASISMSTSGKVYIDIDLNADNGDSLVVSLLNSDVLIDRNVSVTAEAADVQLSHRVTVPLAFVATDSGRASLTAKAQVIHNGTTQASGIANFTIDVNVTRRQVLFVDRRPSWMSTFVRRALERDADMLVTSRVTTSRGISTVSGRPPSLADSKELSSFDVVVVGSPEALSAREISSLESFLRDRGGSVLMLLDQRASGPYEKLVRNNSWIGRTEYRSIGAASSNEPPNTDSVSTLRVSEWVAPRVIPFGATPMLVIADSSGSTTEGSAVVWRLNVGIGTLMVSGALDAWRFRDSTTSRFVDFWRSSVATLAAAAVPPVELRLVPTVAASGSPVELRALIRSALIGTSDSAGVTVKAYVERAGVPGSGPDTQSLRVWPTATPGVVSANFNAPSVPGRYRIVFKSSPGAANDASARPADSAETELVVADSVTSALSSNESMMRMLASTHGGSKVNESDLGSLAALISKGIRQTERRSPWFPMRSGWWIIPFAALLSIEWYIRRMSGLP